VSQIYHTLTNGNGYNRIMNENPSFKSRPFGTLGRSFLGRSSRSGNTRRSHSLLRLECIGATIALR
jgi:hypothetical protein